MDTQLTVRNLQHQSWAVMVQQQVNSGLPINEWCEQNGISSKTFYYRRKRIREEMLQAAGPMFAELTPPVTSGSPVPAVPAEGFTPAIMISVNGMSIAVSRDTPRQLLSDVLEAVRHA